MVLSVSLRGRGKPLVLLHPFPLNHHMFRNVEIPGHQLILPDFPGFGSAHVLDPNFSMEMAAEILKIYLDSILPSPSKIVLGGVSMGGYWAFEFIRKYPEKVEKLILISTKACDDTPESRNKRLEMANKVEKDGMEDLSESLVPGLLGMTTLSTKPEVVDAVKGLIHMANPHGIAQAQRAMASRRDQTNLLHGLMIPTLVVTGQEDKLIPMSEAELMAKMIPHCKFQVITYSGHLIPMEQPAPFVKIVNDFLN